VFATARIVVLSGDRRHRQWRCHWQAADRRSARRDVLFAGARIRNRPS